MKEKKLLTTILAVFIAIGVMVQSAAAQSNPPNEFIIDVANYDDLSANSKNCTFRLDRNMAVTFCDNGYLAIDDIADLVNPDTAFKVDANYTFQLIGSPKDLRLDTYLSIVDQPGEKVTVIKRSTMKAIHIELDQSAAPTGVIQGGYFSPDFIVFHIENQGEQFLQVHTSKTALGVIASIDSKVKNYQVLDLAQTKNLFYVFAVQEVAAGQNQLVMIQTVYEPTTETWGSPAQVNYPLSTDQCGDKLRVTESLVILACSSTKTISVMRRSNMEPIYTRSFQEDRFYFQELFVISHNDGKQSYIFYTMSSFSAHRIGMIETILDEAKSNTDQLVLDRGELSVPVSSDPENNQGPITLGGGEQYLLTTFERFNQIKGYTMCAYDQVLQSDTLCKVLPTTEEFTLNPFDSTVTKCGQKVLGINEQKKLAFLCAGDEEDSLDIFMVVVLVTLAFGGLCCCASFCVFCKYRAKANNAIEDAQNLEGEHRVHDPMAAQRQIEQANKQKLTLLSKSLTRKKFSSSAYKENQENCAICVEDFLPSTMIRETPCKHIFHDHCVMKWIETKLSAPDCPFCRAEIKLNNNA